MTILDCKYVAIRGALCDVKSIDFLVTGANLLRLWPNRWKVYSEYTAIVSGFHGVMVSTLDSESSDPSSNLGGTSKFFHFFEPPAPG